MAFISSIDVVLWNAPSIGKVLPLLHAAGWQFWNNQIQSCYFYEIGEEEDFATVSPEQWPELAVLWDEECQKGKTVQIMYCWREHPDKPVTVWFSRKMEQTASLLTVQFIMYPAWKRLCGDITDYSWYLERLVCPLENGDCGVLDVTCHDENP